MHFPLDSLDPVHPVKNLLMLALNHHANLFANLLKLRGKIFKGLYFSRIYHHHHIEKALNDRLRNVQNVYAVSG